MLVMVDVFRVILVGEAEINLNMWTHFFSCSLNLVQYPLSSSATLTGLPVQ